jgi:hypothetical protein
MAAEGDCTVSMTSAYVDRGVVTEGPYLASATVEFAIAAAE